MKKVTLITSSEISLPKKLRSFRHGSSRGTEECRIVDNADPYTGEIESYAFSYETEKHLRFLISLLDGGRP